jgi:hypothetical protein
LNALITPNGAPTKAWFQWGTTTNYGNSTADQNMNGAAALNLSAAIASGVATYHYRAAASNDLGLSFGANQTFTWNPAPVQIGAFGSSNNSWRLEFGGSQNQAYLVQFSTNLIDWIALGKATNSGSIFSFDHPKAAGFNSGFYRVVAP